MDDIDIMDDMDIPDPDELQWLQANSNLHDYFHYDPEEEHHTHSSPSSSSTKRLQQTPQSDPPISENPDTTESKQHDSRKRSKVELPEPVVVEDKIDDEDWLPPPAPEVVEQEVPEEIIVSRYASQIEGEFVPVTGPRGDRVYAKISRFDFDDSVKNNKLDSNAYSNGFVRKFWT